MASWNDVAADVNFTMPVDVEGLASLVRSDARILDLGCGYGRIVRELVDWGFSCVGYDVAPQMIERGLAENPELDLRVLDGETIPEDSASFDAVVCCALFASVLSDADAMGVVSEIRRLLGRGGVLHCAEFLRSADLEYGAGSVTTSSLGVSTRHLDASELRSLLSEFSESRWREFEVNSISGRVGRGVHYFGRRA